MKFEEIKPGMVIHCQKEEDARVLVGYLAKEGYAWSWSRENLSNSDIKYAHGSDTCYCVSAYGKYIYNCDIKDAEGLITEFSDLAKPDAPVPAKSIFKPGDKVRVKEGLVVDHWYNGINFSESMNQYKGQVLTIETENCGGYYTEEDRRWLWSDDMLEFAADSPMSAVEVLEWLRDNDGKHAMKDVFGCTYYNAVMDNNTAQEVVDKITAYEAAKKAPKPIETEWDDICRIIQIDSNGVKRCVHEEDITGRPELVDMTVCELVESILKKYILEHEGKYFAVIENVCRVKEGES